MKISKNNNKIDPETYEDMVRLDRLDPCESLIKYNVPNKQNNRSIE